MSNTPKILSIQSHVISGYVGNKSATFPLQLLGFEVDTINSVQLSNHTGYKVFPGQVLNANDLENLMDGLAQNDLDNDYTHLLTGYVGSPSFLKTIASLVKTLKSKNPQLVYVCDPVMGDNGKMYVPQELKEIYQQDIIPLADIITPNQFELELLTDKQNNTLEQVRESMKELHKRGPSIIAVSSMDANDEIVALISSSKENQQILRIDIPKISVNFTGSGDLFAALLLAHLHSKDDVKIAFEKTINSLQAILARTYKHYQKLKDENLQYARKIELRLIQSKDHIENPPNRYNARFI